MGSRSPHGPPLTRCRLRSSGRNWTVRPALGRPCVESSSILVTGSNLSAYRTAPWERRTSEDPADRFPNASSNTDQRELAPRRLRRDWPNGPVTPQWFLLNSALGTEGHCGYEIVEKNSGAVPAGSGCRTQCCPVQSRVSMGRNVGFIAAACRSVKPAGGQCTCRRCAPSVCASLAGRPVPASAPVEYLWHATTASAKRPYSASRPHPSWHDPAEFRYIVAVCGIVRCSYHGRCGIPERRRFVSGVNAIASCDHNRVRRTASRAAQPPRLPLDFLPGPRCRSGGYISSSSNAC